MAEERGQSLRLGDPSFPFSVGLFVGADTTPNKVGDAPADGRAGEDEQVGDYREGTARAALAYYRTEGRKPTRANPFQLSECPWCGEELTSDSYSIKWDQILRTRCVRKGCFFASDVHPIPAYTVDENLYMFLPSLVIGTVDKFAMLPFMPRMAMLFGHVSSHCERDGFASRESPHQTSHNDGSRVVQFSEPLPPPDLVIQDELHLLSGPLGSMVGLYETTIERLCRRDGSKGPLRPKVVASSATIRRAEDQVWGIFARATRRFPPAGTEIEDSFFVREGVPERDSKLYVGLFPSGIASRTVMKRTLVSVLLGVSEVERHGVDVKDWDSYWTTVCYFNSIRELGTNRTTIEDDVQNDLHGHRDILPVPELTSQMDSRDLPEILSRLATPARSKNAVSVLVCSNMFSVGVDIQRLGLMVVNHQPKSTSEYLQATGRVGRSCPGLILVLYSWGRPRDQSHFERFYDYHNRIQSHVESMTVTPFSEGAIARALHAQFVGILRAIGPSSVVRSSQAGHFDAGLRASAQVNAILSSITDRMASVTGESTVRASEVLDTFLDEWVQYAGEALWYSSNPYRHVRLRLMKNIDDSDLGDVSGPLVLTPTSMRNVERQVPLDLRLRRG